MQNHSADQLHVVMPHVEKSTTGFAAYRKGFDQDVVNCFALGQSLTKSLGFLFELIIGKYFVLGLQRIDGVNFGLQPLDVARVGRSEKVRQQLLKTLEQPTKKNVEEIPNSLEKFFHIRNSPLQKIKDNSIYVPF